MVEPYTCAKLGTPRIAKQVSLPTINNFVTLLNDNKGLANTNMAAVLCRKIIFSEHHKWSTDPKDKLSTNTLDFVYKSIKVEFLSLIQLFS